MSKPTNKEESKAEVEDLFSYAQGMIGGEWETMDPNFERCELAAGGEGVRYVFARFGPGVPVEEQEALIEAVSASWGAAGLEATRIVRPEYRDVVVTELRHPAAGYGEDDIWMRFTVSPRSTSLSAQSRCVPGTLE